MPCLSAPRRRLPGAWWWRTHGHLHVIPGPVSSLLCKMCNFRPSRGTQAYDGDRVPEARGVRQTHPLRWQQALARGRRGPVHLSLRPASGDGGTPSRPFSGRPPCPSAVQSRGSWGHPGPSPGVWAWGGSGLREEPSRPLVPRRRPCSSVCGVPGASVQPAAPFLLPPDGQPGPGCRLAVSGLQSRLPELLIKLHKYLMPNY